VTWWESHVGYEAAFPDGKARWRKNEHSSYNGPVIGAVWFVGGAAAPSES